MNLTLRGATVEDAALVVAFIRDLAKFEQLSSECHATEEQVRASLFGERPVAECLLAFEDNEPAGFAVFFFNYSTFLARPGLYLEDLFVKPSFRKKGIGRALILHLAKLANERKCAGGWNGQCWTGMNLRSISIEVSVPNSSMSGEFFV